MKKIIISAGLVVLIDRITKILVQTLLVSQVNIIKNFLYLIYVRNNGAAFSILEDKQIFLIMISIIFLFLLIGYIKKYNISNIFYGILIGGIIGNLIDRVLYGYVIDFIGFKIFNYTAPIFNIADIAITVGAICIIFLGSGKNDNKIG